MKSTVTTIMEAGSNFNNNKELKNMKVFESLDSITEQQNDYLGYTAKKVVLAGQKDGNVLCEYSNNLERFMKDQAIDINEAIDQLEDQYDLCPGSIAIVVDESCINKIDLDALYENIKDYDDVIVIAGNDNTIDEFVKENNILVKNINGLEYFELKDKFIFLANSEGTEARIFLLSNPKPIVNDSQDDIKEVGFEFKTDVCKSSRIDNIANNLLDKFDSKK